jgi:phospholipase A1/A2
MRLKWIFGALFCAQFVAGTAWAADDEGGMSSLVRPQGKMLEDEWTPANTPLAAYKQNYILVTQTDHQNSAPSSPNPRNNVPFNYPYDTQEAHFQFSFKSSWMLPFKSQRHVIWFGYTQDSFWQSFDGSHSRPFRENNYEPELIYSYRVDNKFMPSGRLKIINVALEHQSNGMPDPQSRSWSRIYIEPGFEFPAGENNWLIVLPRIWRRIDQGSGPAQDNNPDIIHYMGQGDLEIRDNYEGSFPLFVSSLIRIRAFQLDIGFPAKNLLNLFTNVNLDIHYFTGYGECLSDYNQKHQTIGLGLSLPY